MSTPVVLGRGTTRIRRNRRLASLRSMMFALVLVAPLGWAGSAPAGAAAAARGITASSAGSGAAAAGRVAVPVAHDAVYVGNDPESGGGTAIGEWPTASVFGWRKTDWGTAKESLSVIDAATDQPQLPIPITFFPFGVAANPDGSRVYVASAGLTSVSVVNTATGQAVYSVPLGHQAFGVAVSPDGQYVYATSQTCAGDPTTVCGGSSSGVVSVIQTASDTGTDVDTVAATVPVGGQPAGLAVSPDGSRVYVADVGSNDVSVIDTGTNSVVDTISVPGEPEWAAVSPDGSKVYVTQRGANTVAVIDSRSDQVIDEIPVGGQPYGVAENADGSKLYVTDGGTNAVSVIDGRTDEVVATVPVGTTPLGVAVTSDGSKAYVSNYGSNSLSVIDGRTDKVVDTVPVGTTPFGVAVAPLPPPTIITAVPKEGVAHRPYSAKLSATGGALPYHWSVVSGALPSGLRLAPSGVISGTPTGAGTSVFTAKVTDSSGASSQELFWVTITRHGSTSTATSTASPSAPAGGRTDHVPQGNRTATPAMGTAPYGYIQTSAIACGASATCGLPITPDTVLAQAQALVKPITPDGKSLADLGYNVIKLNGDVQGPRNGPVDPLTGQPTLTPNPTQWGTTANFVSVIQKIEHDIVSPKYHLHLEVGYYSDWGASMECASRSAWTLTDNGLYDHEITDARTFASWGISFVELDGTCGLGISSGYGAAPAGFITEMTRITDAFRLYAPHTELETYWEGATPQLSGTYELGGNATGSFPAGNTFVFSSVLDHIDEGVAAGAPDVVGPGSWDDMDYLLVDGTLGDASSSPLSPEEQQSQFGIEALEASPLLVGTDLRVVVGAGGDPDHALNFLTNAQMIAVDQDRRGDMARVVEGPIVPADSGVQGTYQVLSKVLAVPGERAVGLLNRTASPMAITVHFSDLRCNSGGPGGLSHVTKVEDLWTHTDIDRSRWANGSYTTTVPGHGIDILKIKGASRCSS